jgi:hypothetical protein
VCNVRTEGGNKSGYDSRSDTNVVNQPDSLCKYPIYLEYKVIHLRLNNNILSKCIRMNK